MEAFTSTPMTNSCGTLFYVAPEVSRLAAEAGRQAGGREGGQAVRRVGRQKEAEECRWRQKQAEGGRRRQMAAGAGRSRQRQVEAGRRQKEDETCSMRQK